MFVVGTPVAGEKPQDTQAAPNEKAIEGSYYRGRGPAYNLDLTLEAGGKYKATWHSCLYKSGGASGAWTLSGGRVIFTPPMEGEMLKGRLESADVLKSGEQWVLVPTNQQDREFYRTNGVTSFSCFQRIDTASRWAGDWHYENGAMGEFHTLHLRKEGDFSWILRDEPLRTEDTYPGTWQVRGDTLRLSFANGRTRSGETIIPKQRTLTLSMSFDRESLIQAGNGDFRLERTKPLSEGQRGIPRP